MIFNQDFIGYRPNQSVKFSGSDTEETLTDNLKKLPDDWYYRTADITYNYNSLGHRSIEPNNLNLDNYILFTGCSHTEGIGLELERTFPYLTANDLGIDYYNLALGGSGIDVMTHNLMMWIHTVKKLPKALIILWPQTTRFARLKECGELLSFEVPSCTTSTDDEKFMVMGENINFFETVHRSSKKIINAAYTCNTLHLQAVMLEQIDVARDLSHAGTLSNRYLADYIIHQLS